MYLTINTPTIRRNIFIPRFRLGHCGARNRRAAGGRRSGLAALWAIVVVALRHTRPDRFWSRVPQGRTYRPCGTHGQDGSGPEGHKARTTEERLGSAERLAPEGRLRPGGTVRRPRGTVGARGTERLAPEARLGLGSEARLGLGSEARFGAGVTAWCLPGFRFRPSCPSRSRPRWSPCSGSPR